MKHTLFVATGAAGLLALGVAVPALASTGSSPTSSSSSSATGQLSSSQLQSIEDFLADHPNLAQALAGRAAGWATFLDANPTLKTELTKVAAMPADQRRAALKAWLKANPSVQKALQEYRIGNKQAKLTKQQNRLKQRLQRLQSPSTPAPTTPAPSPSA